MIFFSLFEEYCRSNTEDINNNIVEFKEAVQIANVELDNKIVGCGKDLERCRADFSANLEKSFTELDEVWGSCEGNILRAFIIRGVGGFK